MRQGGRTATRFLPPTARIRPRAFVHIVDRTRRFAQMLDWTQRVFDAHGQHQNPALALLTGDGAHHRFTVANMDVLAPGAPDGARGAVGVDQVACAFASLADLFAKCEERKAERIRPCWCIHHPITVSLHDGDPDGKQMECQVDCFAADDEANACMAGPGFAANPIGAGFDPEDWLARRGAGTPMDSFLPRHTHLPVSPVRGALQGA